MGYYTGTGLAKQVERHGLTAFEKEVAKVAAGEAKPQAIMIAVDDPAELGKVRLLVYSVLHSHGLKERYKVESKGNALLVRPMVRAKIFTVASLTEEILYDGTEDSKAVETEAEKVEGIFEAETLD